MYQTDILEIVVKSTDPQRAEYLQLGCRGGDPLACDALDAKAAARTGGPPWTPGKTRDTLWMRSLLMGGPPLPPLASWGGTRALSQVRHARARPGHPWHLRRDGPADDRCLIRST